MSKLLWSCFKKYLKIKIDKIREWYNQCIQDMKSYANKIDLSSSVYEDLVPKDDIDKSDSYIYALDWAISNNKIYNIALTGTYGSGKSSVLRTYEKERPHNHYLKISLASFYEQKEMNSNFGQSKEIDDQIPNKQKCINGFSDIEIEKSILQQLFYKVSPNQIPYTRFRKIINVKIPQLALKVCIAIFTLILGGILFDPSVIINLQNNIAFLNTYYGSGFLIEAGYIIFFILIIFLIIRTIKYLNMRLRLSKITISKAELEFDKANNESIFNKYLDEILYFFEVSKYNIVLIEDLDRFDNTRIFTKLRELNSLINCYEQIKRRIVFIYAIKDDMFKNGDRTKFFDFIIPVIPVINSTNSGEILLKKVRQNSLGQDITDEFINGVSIYIDDMRILNNIYNEFILYKNVLTDVTLKSQQILALIVYKNLYPNDFSELEYNRGITYQAFSNKKDYINKKLLYFQEKIHDLEEKINQANQEYLSSVKELKAAFIYNLVGQAGNVTIVRVNTKNGYPRYIDYSIGQIIDDDNFDLSLLDNYNLTIIHDGRSDSSSMNIANQRSGSDLTYLERLEAIKIKDKSKQNQLKQEMEKLKSEEHTLGSLTLRELINKFTPEDVLGKEVLKYKVIVYLLRNGYIDETYTNYLTYFYPNSLTAQDMNFILGVRNHEALRFSYSLTKIERLLSKLNAYEFEQKEILNFNLFEFLLENKEKYQSYFNTVIKQLTDETSTSITFIDEFKDQTNHLNLFWTEICHQWNNIWGYIEDNSDFMTSKKDEYLKNIVEFADISDIEKINYNNKISTYITNNKEFLRLTSGIDLLKVEQVISKLDIKFKMIDTQEVNEEFLDYVMEHDFYVININMIKIIVDKKSPENEQLLAKSNLSTIKKAGYNPLLKYINQDIEKYLNDVFLKIETNDNEDIETIIELLKRPDISDNTKNSIINKENMKLPNITSVPESLWDKIISNFKIQINWDNVFIYYKKVKEINNILTNFFNSESIFKTLSLNKFNTVNEKDENILSIFSNQLIASSISDSAFNYLVKSIPYVYKNCEIDALSDRKVDILINNDILKFTTENYNRLKEHFPGKHITFIEKYHEEYFNEMEKYTLNVNDLSTILKSNCFSIGQKFKIISNINVSIANSELLRQIYEITIGSTVKYQLTQELFKNIWTTILPEDKLKLLINQATFLDNNTITDCLNDLGDPYELITMPKRRVKIKYTNELLTLAKELKSCEYISTYTETNNNVGKKLIQFNTKNII